MEYLTIKQVAAELQLSIETIRRLVRSGQLRASALETPPGRAGYRIRRADLEALLEARARGGAPKEDRK
jgi:excisionase family DNA binding protein